MQMNNINLKINCLYFYKEATIALNSICSVVTTMYLKGCEIEVGIVKVEVADALPLAPGHTQHCGGIVFVVEKVQVTGEHVDATGGVRRLILKTLV